MVIDYQMNPGKYSKGQLKQNASEAAAIYAATGKDARYVYHACVVTLINADAAYVPTLIYKDVNYWIDQYFEVTKENKQDYIDEINRGK